MADGCRNSEDCLVFGQAAWKLTMGSKPITGRREFGTALQASHPLNGQNPSSATDKRSPF
jgi:hypothetical protein